MKNGFVVNFVITTCFVLFFNDFLFAQNKDTTSKYVIDLISFLEKEKGIKFSYNDDAILGLKINLKNNNITSFLRAINNQTPLTSKKVKDNSYILFKKKKKINIRGKVIDAYTEENVSEILVSHSRNSVYTDEKGEFSIEITTSDTITFSGFGYNLNTIKGRELLGDDFPVIKIFEQSEQLDEVVLISEYITLGVDKKNDGSIELKPGKLKVIPGLVEPDVFQSLQLLPGIVSIRAGATDINIRGGTEDQNLILWDGIKIYNSGHLFQQISAFNPYVVESIKSFVSKTPIHFSLHTGGVIDINSITKVPKKARAAIGANLTNYDANLQIPFSKKVGLILGGRLSDNKFLNNKFDNIKKKIFQNTNLDENGIMENITDFNNELNFYDLNLKLIWDLSDRSKLQISSILMEDELDFNSEISNSIKTVDTIKLTNSGVSLQWKKTTAKKNRHNFSTYYSKYDYDLRRNLDLGLINYNSGQENIVKDVGGLYKYNHNFNEKVGLNSGYQYSYNEIVYGESNEEEDFFGIQNFNINDKLNTHSVFSEFIYRNSFFEVEAGIKANYFYELEESFLEPRISTSFKLSNQLNIDFSIESKGQVLRRSYQTSNRRLPSITNAWVLTSTETTDNKAIPNLTSQQYSLGMTYNIKDFGIIFESYLNKNQGLVVLNNDTETINDDLYYTGKGTIVGVDLLLKKKIGKFRSWLGYSLSQSVVFFPDIQERDFFNKDDVTQVINWSNTIDIGNFEVGLSLNYRTGLKYSFPSNAVLDENGNPKLMFDNLNNLRLPSFQTFNTSMLYTLKSRKSSNMQIKLGVSVQNIFSRRNIISREYSLERTDDNIQPDISFEINNGTIVNAYKQDGVSFPLNPDIIFRLNF